MLLELSYIEAYNTLKPLAIFILGMVIYSVFIFNFYRFLAKIDVFDLNLSKHNTASHSALASVFAILLYGLEYLILLPFFIFFWFAVLAFLLAFLSKTQSLESILLVAIAVVGTVRICAFYNEDLARDIAKMLPFALLGIFLIDIEFFIIGNTFSLFNQIPLVVNTLVYYWLFIVSLELILRILNIFFWNKHNDVEKE